MSPTAATRSGARVVLGPGVVVYLGAAGHAEAHAHSAVQLVWAREGTLSLALPDRTVEASAALVPANVRHAVSAEGQRVALLLVERHGRAGMALERLAQELLGVDLGPRLGALAPPPRGAPPADALAWARRALSALGVHAPRPRPSRPTRIAIAHVEAWLDRRPRLAEAAARAGLSPSHLTDRLTEEVGIPFHRFVLWLRLRRAVEAFRAGASLADAATAAGFSDAVQLSRTFRAMVGLGPADLLPVAELAGSLSPGEGDWAERAA